jgi:hypothetical protein
MVYNEKISRSVVIGCIAFVSVAILFFNQPPERQDWRGFSVKAMNKLTTSPCPPYLFVIRSRYFFL